MSRRRRVTRLEESAHLQARGSNVSRAGCVVIYTGRDAQGQVIPKDDASRAAMARPGAKFYVPDNGR